MKRKLLSDYAWNSFSSYTEMVLRFIGTMILARALLPEDFGVVAYIVSVFTLVSSVVGWDAGAFVIQAKHHRTHVNTLLFGQVFLGAALAAVVFVFSSLLFPDMQGLFVVILLIGVSKILEQVLSPIAGFFQKNMQFRMLSLIKIASEFASFVLMVWLLSQGEAFWSLVSFTVAGLLIRLLVQFCIYLPRLRFEWSKRTIRAAFDFGKYGLFTTFLDRGFRQADDIYIKHFFGAFTLGLYSQAYRFSELFSNLTWGGIGAVTSSLFGRLKEKKNDLRRLFLAVSSMTIHAVMLLYLPLFILAEKAVLLLYGPNWSGVVPFIRLLMVFALLTPLRRLFRSLKIYTGDTRAVAHSQLAEVIVFLVLLFTLPFIFGMIGVIVSVTLAIIVGVWLLYRKVSLLFPVSLFRLVVVPVLYALASAALYFLIQPIIPSLSLIVDVIVRAGIIAGAYALMVLLFHRKELIALYRLARSSS